MQQEKDPRKGCRIGEALGLRHEDIGAASRVLRIEPRANSNGARVKNHSGRSVPVSGQLVRLWGDYLYEEYGDLDCDYVLSRHPDNTYCPEPGVIRTGHAQLLVIAMTLFRSTT